MAPAKRKAAAAPPPAPVRSSTRLSTKIPKMTTAKCDAVEMTSNEANLRAPRVQVPHDCKERLDELTRILDLKTLGSTVNFLLPTPEGAKGITELTRALGYDNCGQTIDWLLEMVRTKQFQDLQNERRQLDWLSPSQIVPLQELTRELGFSRGGETVDWILPMVSKGFLNITLLLGFRESTETMKWLFQQAKPAIAAIIGRHTASTGYGRSPAAHVHAPLFPAPQFPQNSQAVGPINLAPTGGLAGEGATPRPRPTGGVGRGSNPRYSSNLYTPITTPSTPTHTPVQSSAGCVTAHRSGLPISNTHFNGFPGEQSQTNGYGQVQMDYLSSNGLFNSARVMQSMPHPESQINTSHGKAQQPSPEKKQVGKKRQVRRKAEKKQSVCTGNNAGPEVRAGAGVSTPMQYSINNHPNCNAASVNYGDRAIRMDQLQAPPRVNQLVFQGANFLRGVEGTYKAQNHSRPLEMPVQNSSTAANNANYMSSWAANPNPAPADIIGQEQAPSDHNLTERRNKGHDPNQVVHDYYNGGQSTSFQFPIDLRSAQGNGGTPMAELPLMRNQTTEANGAGAPSNPQSELNGAWPLTGFNETNLQEVDNPLQQNGVPMNETVNNEIETQEKQQQECSTFLHKVGNHSRASQLPLQNGGTAVSNAHQMSSWTPSHILDQAMINQEQASSDYNSMERIMGGHDPNQLVQNYYNGDQSTAVQFPVGLRCGQGNGETPMAGLPLMDRILETDGAGVQSNPQSQLNGEQPLDGFNKIRLPQEDDNTSQQYGVPMNEAVNIEIDNQQQGFNESLHFGIERQTEKQQDVTSEMEGRTDGERNAGLPGAEESTNEQVGDTNIVQVDAVDIKDAEVKEWGVDLLAEAIFS